MLEFKDIRRVWPGWGKSIFWLVTPKEDKKKNVEIFLAKELSLHLNWSLMFYLLYQEHKSHYTDKGIYTDKYLNLTQRACF